MREEIISFLGEDWKAFQSIYSAKLASEIPLLDHINGFLLDNGGKQLRPMMTLLIAKALSGVCSEGALSIAAAVEMLHTATLLHDDVADDSPTRRGVPTVMALFTPTTSVLVGDYWLSKAVDLVVVHSDPRIIKIFSKCLSDLAEGEMLQMAKAESLDTSEEDYRQIIYRKTASLFIAAACSVAWVLGADDAQVEAVGTYARHIGISFQMMDDILDYSPELALGKPTGQDVLEKKITLPLLGMMQNAPAEVTESFILKMKNPSEDLAAQAVDLVRKYGGFEFAEARLEQEVALAKASLGCLPSSSAKDYLIRLADYMSLRRR